MTLAHNDASQEPTLAAVATLDLDVVERRTAELVARNAWPREQLIQFQHESFARCCSTPSMPLRIIAI